MNRRSVLGNAAAGLVSTTMLGAMPAGLLAMANTKGINMPIGFQSYVFRDVIALKPEETMNRLAGYGYQNVEWCSPKGYQGEFAPLEKSSVQEVKQIPHDAVLQTTS